MIHLLTAIGLTPGGSWKKDSEKRF